MDSSVPVVVLRAPHHGGLGIVRSLGRLGIRVCTIDAERWTPAFRSRYSGGNFVLDIEYAPVEESLTRVVEIGKSMGGRPLLIPTTDQSAIWAADHAGALAEYFRFPRQPASLVRTLCDKSLMQELAAKHGVFTARSAVPRSREDVHEFLRRVDLPLMVKAIDDRRLRSRVGATKIVVYNQCELMELWDKAQDPENPNLMLQEFIPGRDWMFNGYFDSASQCLSGATGRKIRRFPAQTGVTSLGICVPNETVKRTTVNFMKAIGYRGILDIGYRFDFRDRRYKVLDVNPRIGCTFRLFAAGEMDVARAMYLDLTGQPVAHAEARKGRKWMVEDFDLASALASVYKRRLGTATWIRSLKSIDETACFTLDDPLPAVMIALADCRDLCRWLRRRKPAKRSSAVNEEGVEPLAQARSGV